MIYCQQEVFFGSCFSFRKQRWGLFRTVSTVRLCWAFHFSAHCFQKKSWFLPTSVCQMKKKTGHVSMLKWKTCSTNITLVCKDHKVKICWERNMTPQCLNSLCTKNWQIISFLDSERTLAPYFKEIIIKSTV